MFLLSISAHLYPNMTNFDAVDFSERRTEEVISFFLTLTVDSNRLCRIVEGCECGVI